MEDFNYALNRLKFAIVNKMQFLDKMMHVNYGLKQEEWDDRNFVMGDNSLNFRIIKEDGKWLKEAETSAKEIQKGLLFDTMDCTHFALTNVLQMLVKALYNYDWNISDKYPGVYKGTTRDGNTPTNQLKAFKNYGLIFEDECPWDRSKFTWNDYHGYKPEQSLIDLGLKRLEEYDFGWDSIWATQSALREAIKYAPLYVGGYAWMKRGMLYYSAGNPNHMFTCVDVDQMIARDSYNPFIKNLAPDYQFYYVKRIYFRKKNEGYNMSFINGLKNKGFKYIQRTDAMNGGHGEVYELLKDGIKELSDQEKMEKGIKTLAEFKVMTGVSEKDYKTITNQ